MVKCSAPYCTNYSHTKTPGISFHRFPKDEYLKNVWLMNMNKRNWQPKSCHVLCSEHFETNLIDNSGFRTVLASGAIPTIFYVLLQENPPTLVSLKRKVSGDHVIWDGQNDNNIQHHNVPAKIKESNSIQEPNKINSDLEDSIVRDKQIKKLKSSNVLKNKQIKYLKQQNRRLKTKVAHLSEIISRLKEKLK